MAILFLLMTWVQVTFASLNSTLFSNVHVLLRRFSRVRLCATPETAAHQDPPSLGFSRQEYCSGLPLPSPMCESEVAQSCPTLRDPMDCSPPGSSAHGISQARVLEWGAIAFSGPCTTLIILNKASDSVYCAFYKSEY